MIDMVPSVIVQVVSFTGQGVTVPVVMEAVPSVRTSAHKSRSPVSEESNRVEPAASTKFTFVSDPFRIDPDPSVRVVALRRAKFVSDPADMDAVPSVIVDVK